MIHVIVDAEKPFSFCNNSTKGLNFKRAISSFIINHKVCKRAFKYFLV
jgi:hypothetical protein